MTKPILDDELWALIEPLLPPHKVRHAYYLGRKPLNDRAVLTGILFIRSLCDWRQLAYATDCTKFCLRGYAQPT